jgi:ketosteroid isomerase-like protein
MNPEQETGQSAPDVSAGMAAFEEMLRAFAVGDVDGVVAVMAEDVLFEPPAFLVGEKTYSGHEGVREALVDIGQRLGPENRIRAIPKRYFADRSNPRQLLILVGLTVIRPDLQEFGADATLLLTMRDDKVAVYRSWANLDDGLAFLADPVEVRA